MFNRVLRGDDEERLRQLVGFLADSDFTFLHGLQQRGLSLRWRAVDFVGQQNVREDRAFHEAELAAAGFGLVEHVRAGDVRRHQIGRELNSFELHVENVRDRADDQCFGESRHADQQAVPAREDGRQNLLDDGILADDDLVQFGGHQLAAAAEFFQEFVEVTFLGQGRLVGI